MEESVSGCVGPFVWDAGKCRLFLPGDDPAENRGHHREDPTRCDLRAIDAHGSLCEKCALGRAFA